MRVTRDTTLILQKIGMTESPESQESADREKGENAGCSSRLEGIAVDINCAD